MPSVVVVAAVVVWGVVIVVVASVVVPSVVVGVVALNKCIEHKKLAGITNIKKTN